MSEPIAQPVGTEGRGALLPERLVSGYEAFLSGRFKREQDRFHALAEAGQKPRIMLIGCCDSRVSPEVIFDAAPGELFVVRNIANLVPPYAPNDDLHGTSAALEFGVMGLGVEHIVLMGHASCGGVGAFARGTTHQPHVPLSPGDFIGKWISLMGAAAERVGPATQPLEDYIERLALASIIQGLANLRSFPWIAARERSGELGLHGAYFGIQHGTLLALNEGTGQFEPVAIDKHRAAFAAHRETVGS
ncbi:carbonate dehydratase [Beijerinckiaceae bacterium]|nr:carbonate dehydratase [Beijerinckiaceae bacterium]